MYRQTDGQMGVGSSEPQMYGCTDRKMDEWIHGYTARQMDTETDRWRDRCIDVRVSEQTDSWMNGWMHMNGWRMKWEGSSGI